MSRISPSVRGEFNDPTESVVRLTTAANRSLNAADHAGRLVVIEAEFTNAAQTITMPKANGSGARYELVNILAPATQNIVVAALGADVFRGISMVLDSTAQNAGVDVFQTSATSDKYTFDKTTTGGLGGDRMVLVDVASGTWQVEVLAVGSGNVATGFSETA